MGARVATVAISDDAYAAAQRIAEIDHVSVGVLIESLVKRHAEYIDSLNAVSEMPRFSLDEYEMQRDPGETDEHYEARLDLFR
jgi:hypothetical protein